MDGDIRKSVLHCFKLDKIFSFLCLFCWFVPLTFTAACLLSVYGIHDTHDWLYFICLIKRQPMNQLTSQKISGANFAGHIIAVELKVYENYHIHLLISVKVRQHNQLSLIKYFRKLLMFECNQEKLTRDYVSEPSCILRVCIQDIFLHLIWISCYKCKLPGSVAFFYLSRNTLRTTNKDDVFFQIRKVLFKSANQLISFYNLITLHFMIYEKKQTWKNEFFPTQRKK